MQSVPRTPTKARTYTSNVTVLEFICQQPNPPPLGRPALVHVDAASYYMVHALKFLKTKPLIQQNLKKKDCGVLSPFQHPTTMSRQLIPQAIQSIAALILLN